MGSRGRGDCGECQAPVIITRTDLGLTVVLDARPAEHGDYAVWHTVADGWVVHYAPVGEPVLPPYYRYRRHDCELSAPPAEPAPQAAAA